MALGESLLLWVTGLELSFQNCLMETVQAGKPGRTSSQREGFEEGGPSIGFLSSEF